MTSNLLGKTAIVTGGSRGIGAAIAIALAKAGVNVAVVSRSGEIPTKIAEAAGQTGAKVKAYSLDLANVSVVAERLQEIVADWSSIDILINNAGMGYVAPIADIPLADWQRVMDLNVTSVVQCLQAVLPTMRSQHSGTIINIASIAAKQGFPNWGAYCASKFALLGLTQSLAAEERSHGIKVMSICPGSVDTEIWDTLEPEVAAQFDRKAMLKADAIAEVVMSMLALPPNAEITDLVLMSSAGVL